MAVKLVFAEDRTRVRQAGIWFCDKCGVEFHGGGPSCCSSQCPNKPTGYANLTYKFSLYDVALAKYHARRNNDENHPCTISPAVSVATLKAAGHQALIDSTPEAYSKGSDW